MARGPSKINPPNIHPSNLIHKAATTEKSWHLLQSQHLRAEKSQSLGLCLALAVKHMKLTKQLSLLAPLELRP